MKKLILSFLLVIMVNFCFAQLWGSKTFMGRTVGKEQDNWCVFACVEMMTQRTSEQCVAATRFAGLYNQTSVNCCNHIDGDEEFERYCLPGVQLIKLPHFLNVYHNTTVIQINSIYSVFVHHYPGVLSYRFPCYGLIRSLQHCVLVTGIEATFDRIGNKIWIVYFRDPDKGGNPDQKTYYDVDESIGLIFI